MPSRGETPLGLSWYSDRVLQLPVTIIHDSECLSRRRTKAEVFVRGLGSDVGEVVVSIDAVQ